jgi:(p)ppGpp synthase/HD superfamily hydrolase
MTSDAATDLLLTVRAVRFAAEAHSGQRRKGAKPEPYFNHLAEVAHLAAEATNGENSIIIAAAYLHDIIEDTGVTKEDIEKSFGLDIANLVSELTDDPDLDKEEQRQEQIKIAGKLSATAKLLKIADKTSNIRGIADNPPDWPQDEIDDYIKWAIQVVDECRGSSQMLEKRFDDAVLRAEKDFAVKA